METLLNFTRRSRIVRSVPDCPEDVDQVMVLKNATIVIDQVSAEIEKNIVTETQAILMDKAREDIETIEACPNENFKSSVQNDSTILTNSSRSIESAQKAVEEKKVELEKAASGDSGTDKPIAAIVGGTVGGFVALVIIIVFIVKCKKKKQNKSNTFSATSAPRQELWINKSPPEDNSPSTEEAATVITQRGGNLTADQQARSGQHAQVLSTFQSEKETNFPSVLPDKTEPQCPTVHSHAARDPIPSRYPNEGNTIDRPAALPRLTADGKPIWNRAYDFDTKEEFSRTDSDSSPRPAYRRQPPHRSNRDSDHSEYPYQRRAPSGHGRYPRKYNYPHRRSRSNYSEYDRPHRDQQTDREYSHRHQSLSPARYSNRSSRPNDRPTSMHQRDELQPAGRIPRLSAAIGGQDRSQRPSRHSPSGKEPQGYGRIQPTTHHSNGHKSERNHPPSEYRRREPEYRPRTSHRSPEPRPFSYTSQDDRRPGNDRKSRMKSKSHIELDREIAVRREFRRPYSYQDLN
ncbi:uncharacterized protein LOC108679624 [Hyalella azteca]|uniref:Uncharacterized protein LOC108679624 n=1 Tax=Hyalella azteca TaxID=294128 RepID=A0A8B7PDQ7_HYAAZ|nr:uncharacterized protein LOC108679624 [Hyalella azteca]